MLGRDGEALMRGWGPRLFALVASLFAAWPVLAANITPTLLAESPAPIAGGKVTLAIAMDPKPGWHGYWLNPGDAGIPPEIKWSLPPGVRAGPLQYPTPRTLVIGGLMNHVYEGPYAHLVTFDVPPGLSGTLPIRGHFTWLACTDQVCVPEEGDLALELPVGGAADPGLRARFDRYRSALPRPLAAAGRWESENGRLRLAVPLAGVAAKGAHFFAAPDGVLDYAAPQSVVRVGDSLVVETAGKGGAGAIAGVLRTADGRGFEIRAAPGSVPAAEPWLRTAALAFLGAVVGGLILNIMPCVFPILSLKALSLARAGGDERGARAEALAYTAGAVATAALLGGILLGLRASGEAAGWAFQLQNPAVVLILLLLTVAITLNFAGLFELPTLGGRLAGGKGGAFATGALAVFIATPCTGPFMGAALGALIVLPAAAAMAIFVGLGLGLALPFLLLGFVPALRRRLPRPGPWMERFRRILAVPMALTALALAWLLGRQAGVGGMTLALIASLLLALGLWMAGRRQRAGMGIGLAALSPAALALVLVAILPQLAAPPASGALAANAFSEARLAELRASNRPVFVYFTADWCVSCKVNEKAAIERREVGQAFDRAGVVTLVGDWTNADPAIGRFLESHGRTGVPLYLFYRPGREPEILPQILTPGRLTALATTVPKRS